MGAEVAIEVDDVQLQLMMGRVDSVPLSPVRLASGSSSSAHATSWTTSRVTD